MTSPAPMATIVIPAYEAGESVRAALDSALAQTLADIEILVVDDGSADAPVPEDLSDDPRVIVDRRPRNTGYAGVTNHANARARGRWVFYLDADDLMEPDALELLVAAGEVHEADAVWCPQMCVREGTEIGLLEWDPPGAVSDAREALRRVVGHQVVGSQHILLRTPASDAPEGLTYSDLVFVMRHLARSERVAYVDRPLYRYTIHARSATGALSPSVWELADLPLVVRPIFEDAFDPAEAGALFELMQLHNLTHMLHKASREPEATALRAEVTAWCRRPITPRRVLALLRHREWSTAASWMLVKLSPVLHRAAYRTYDRLKSHGLRLPGR